MIEYAGVHVQTFESTTECTLFCLLLLVEKTMSIQLGLNTEVTMRKTMDENNLRMRGARSGEENVNKLCFTATK